MNIIVQAYTGAFNAPEKTPADILISRIVNFMRNASALIIGWNHNTTAYRRLIKQLHAEGKQVYLWLPVFSELSGNQSEEFIFVPPTLLNTDFIKNIYEKHFEDIDFDGVFLDRIRYGSYSDCPDLPIRHKNLRYSFQNHKTNKLYAIKAETVTSSVHHLISWFRSKGLRVGLDLFAPCIAWFAGQDTLELATAADFIKPMLYRRTFAPAGLPYEFQALGSIGKQALKLWGANTPEDDDFFIKQLDALKNAACAVYPGVEINKITDVCNTDIDYVNKSIELIRDNNLAGVVYSWNALETTVFDNC